jgi:hypothetical protein
MTDMRPKSGNVFHASWAGHMGMDDSKIRFSEDEYWTFVSRPPRKDERFITGKYLFFSPNRERLLAIATDEIEHCGFRLAKVSKAAIGGRARSVPVQQ